MDTTTEKMGKRLKAARIARGLSQRELAEELGAHKNSPGNWERGHTVPDAGYRAALIDLLDLPEDFFDNPYGEFEQAVLDELAYIRRALERQAGMVSELDRLVDALEATAQEPKRAD